MSPKNALTLIIATLIVAGIYYLYSRNELARSNIETIGYPPFTIKKKNTYSTRYDINTARRVDNSRTYYSLYYQDQMITYPGALEAKTGVPGLWKAYILKDAPRPALLAGSQSVYLITEEQNKLKVTPVSEQHSGFASLQWLDGADDQPDAKQELYASDDTGKDCQLSGGQFLLVNKSFVLDVSDLSIYPFRISADLTNHYSAGKVIAFSPDQENIVYMGHKYDGKDHYALLIYNFKSNQALTIPFDRTETRLHEPYNLHPDWLTTYFAWKQREDNNLVLERKALDSPPPWEGHFTKGQGFAVSPAKKEMLDVLAAFIRDYLQLSDTDIRLENFGADRQYAITLASHRLEISYLDELESVYFSAHFADKDEPGSWKIIKKVGDAFNARLREGEHQSLFTSY